MPIDSQTLQSAATEVARRAGAELRARFAQPRQIEFKGKIDLVTDADRASEELIVRFIEERFPGHAILAEERGRIEGRAPYRWLVDPLDGTVNYAHGVPHFCISIAVEDEQGLAVAAVFDPVRDELFEAERGQGARLNGERLRVSPENRLDQALLATGFPYNVWSEPDRPLKLLDGFVRRARGVRRLGSAALDMSYVAAGRFDGYFEMGLKPWDIAAGTLIVREAGGTVTDLLAGPVDHSRGDELASNAALHPELVRQVREILAT